MPTPMSVRAPEVEKSADAAKADVWGAVVQSFRKIVDEARGGGAGSFPRRARLLERLEVEVSDGIAAILPADRPTAALSLSLSADAVRRRLEEEDRALFTALQAEIREGLRGRRLEGRLRALVEGGQHLASTEHGYDDLDLLANGLLLGEPLPTPKAMSHPEMVFYQQTPVRVILDLLERASFTATDRLCDLGSGLGHVPILANLLTGVAARGLEFEPAYRDYACRAAAVFDLGDVDFLAEDVRTASFDEQTVFFLYTPFRGHMLDAVLERLHTLSRTRPIRIFSYGPCTATIDSVPWLRRVGIADARIHALAEFRPDEYAAACRDGPTPFGGSKAAAPLRSGAQPDGH